MRASQLQRLFCSSLGPLLCLVLVQVSNAQIRRVQGFEPGDPAVGAIGDSGVKGTYQTETPPEGANQYLITTIKTGDDAGISNQSGANAVSLATLNSSANFGGAAPNGIEGSGVFIPFSILNASEIQLTLQFDFLSNEPAQTVPRNDFAFYALYDAGGIQQGSTVTFASVTSLTGKFTTFGAGSPFQGHTGYRPLTISLAGLAPGNYTLGIGIEDATNINHASGLLIDNIRVVPEPSTIGLGLAGAVLLVAMRKRIKRS